MYVFKTINIPCSASNDNSKDFLYRFQLEILKDFIYPSLNYSNIAHMYVCNLYSTIPTENTLRSSSDRSEILISKHLFSFLMGHIKKHIIYHTQTLYIPLSKKS